MVFVNRRSITVACSKGGAGVPKIYLIVYISRVSLSLYYPGFLSFVAFFRHVSRLFSPRSVKSKPYGAVSAVLLQAVDWPNFIIAINVTNLRKPDA